MAIRKQDIRKQNEAASVAHHEAGHGVIAYRLGLQTGRLTIEPDREAGTLGTSATESEWADGSLDREQILVLYAGYAAEKHYDTDANAGDSYNDDEKAKRLLQFQPPETERELRSTASELVAENWPAIEAVAAALLEHNTFNDDGWTIIIDAIDEGDDWREVLARYLALAPRQNAA